MSFHVSAQSVRAVAGGLVAAATLLSGLALAPTAMAATGGRSEVYHGFFMLAASCPALIGTLYYAGTEALVHQASLL